MKFPVVIIAGLLAPLGAAQAQSTLVRTGEHEDFTRVVVDFPRGTEWRVDRDAGTLRLSGPRAATFDLDGIYARIPRTRVGRIDAEEGGELVVTLGCACEIDTFQTAIGSVVIDVIDSDGAPMPAPEIATLFPDDPLRLPAPPRILPGPLTRALDPSEAARAQQEILTAARIEIGEQLARGVSQGLIDAPEPSPAPQDVAPEAVPEAAPSDSLLDDTPYPNMRVETQIDRDRPGGPTLLEDRACLPSAKFDFAAWGDPEDPFERLRALVPQLTDEAGRKRPEIYADVARTYLFMTFGAEARAVLADSPADTPDRDILTEIARSMDDGLGSAALASQIDCDSNAAILAFLAPDGPRMDDPRAVIRRFGDLPEPLRGYVGPDLAERFADAGLDEAARTVQNAYRLTPSVSRSDDAFVAAKIDGAADEAASESGLEAVVEERLPRAAEAMTFLITSMVERGERVPAATTGQALALSFETADPARAELERAALRAIAARPAIPAAFDELDRLRRISRGPFDDLERDLFARILDQEADSDFLRLMVPLAERPIADPEIRLGIARRLRSQSLWEQAETVIDASRSIPTRAERILRAEIASDAGKPDIARSFLAGLEGPEIDALRTRLGAEAPAPELVPTDAPISSLAARRSPQIRDANELLSRTSALRAELDQLLQE